MVDQVYRVEVIPDQAENAYRGATYTTQSGYIDLNLSEIPARSQGWGYWVRVTALSGDNDVLDQAEIYLIRVTAATTGQPGG